MLEFGRIRKIAVLGSSGSIGRNALDVIANSNGTLEAVLLSVNRQTNVLAEQLLQIASQIKSTNLSNKTRNDTLKLPQWIVITDPNADQTPIKNLPDSILSQIEIFYGHDSLCSLVRKSEIDIVLSALSGCAGLVSTWSALESGKVVALANKESLVSGGSVIKELAIKNHGNLIPVDSEHSAVLQALQCWNMKNYPNNLTNPIVRNITTNKQQSCQLDLSDQTNQTNQSDQLHISEQQFSNHSNLQNVISNITLTASGGPFRTLPLEKIKKVTVEDALNHPTWKMGTKITIDSATMMNKAFEIIEARHFFDLEPSKIKVIIHPQSIIHSMVQFIDGSTIAQLSPPDMRIPISIALHYPDRFETLSICPIDWSEQISLEFYSPDFERFPALSLGYAVAEKGGTTGAVVNAANETAITAFLNGRLPFHDIVNACFSILENHNFEKYPTLSRLLELDTWARKETEKWISQ
ncbi:MAG: 1-deoxy-D-xylulose-5-phosphate reductoisomerase [Planctomycetaceae bacterium]|jgi:1-deoxy-D-xylulose-5-phosphate reductoisomerase|nr:1-deoxy-D-xylulose-5-phosphate reductoisomerase [Planctomycetaceae bacterium]